jgi:hypothetical protein
MDKKEFDEMQKTAETIVADMGFNDLDHLKNIVLLLNSVIEEELSQKFEIEEHGGILFESYEEEDGTKTKIIFIDVVDKEDGSKGSALFVTNNFIDFDVKISNVVTENMYEQDLNSIDVKGYGGFSLKTTEEETNE